MGLGLGEGGGGAREAPTEAKKVAMRICALIDSFDGRLDEVMADPRARAELESIFPGLDEREFRTMLRGCAEGSQVYFTGMDRYVYLIGVCNTRYVCTRFVPMVPVCARGCVIPCVLS